MKLIDKGIAYNVLSEYYRHTGVLQHMALREALDRVPVVDAEPVKRGEWRKTYLDHEAFGERPSILYCSACCACSNVKTNYCPNCGAKMEAEQEKKK